MSYRILVTLTLGGDHKSDFILRDGDMGDLMWGKDFFIKLAQAMTHHPDGAKAGLAWLETHYFNIKTTQVALSMWESAKSRQNWIDTFAERHYIVDMVDGTVSSPEWSQKMDDGDAQELQAATD